MKLCSKIIEPDNKIVKVADKVIGKFLVLEQEIKEFFELLQLLDDKISEKTFVSCYYKFLKDILIGPEWKNTYSAKNFSQLDIFSKNKTSEIMKDILKLIIVLEYGQD